MSENWKLTVGFLCLFGLSLAETTGAQKVSEKNHTKRKLFAEQVAPDDRAQSDPSGEEKKSPAEKKKKVPPENYRLARGAKELVWEVGTSPFNPSNFSGPKEYDVYGRDLHLSTLRFGRVIGTHGPIIYQYLFGATPVAMFTKNEVRNPAFVSPKKTPGIAPTIRRTSWGLGVQPINFRFIFFPGSRLKPFAQVGAGILLTSRSIPVPRAAAFNFTADFGGGFQYFTSRRKAITLGYRYFHISNGNIHGKINNPGYNANVFYLSYSFFYK